MRSLEAPRASHDARALERSGNRVQVAVGTAVTVIAALALIAWASGAMVLAQVVPGVMAMNPLTAIGFFLCAAALLALHRRHRRFAWLVCGLICAVGLARIGQALAGARVSIDQLIFASRLAATPNAPPSRMVISTAIGFVLAGAALALSGSRGKRAALASQLLALGLIGDALFPLIRYALEVVSVADGFRLVTMAVNAAVAFILLAIGIIASRPEGWLMRIVADRGPAGKLSRFVLPLVVLVPVVLGAIRLWGERSGYYDTELGIALEVFANMFVSFTLLMASIAALYAADVARREHELEVWRRKHGYRLAEEMGHVGHWRLDLDTGEFACSDEFKRICGIDLGVEPTAAQAFGLHHPDDSAAHGDWMRAAELTGEGWDSSRRIIRPNGEVRHIQSHGKAELDSAGKVVSLFGVFADVTELERSRQEAETASAARAAFLANMSHEIRTPLNSIIGFTDLILEHSQLPQEVERRLHLVKNAGDALVTVVNDILDFSKMEAGKVELHCRSFDLRTLIDNTVSIIRGSASSKGLALQVQVDPRLRTNLLGDEARLRQIILNLVSNAVKFTFGGFVRISVDQVAGFAGKQRIRFAVADTGIGIAPEVESRLFEQFSQGDSSISREHGGTGLGLAICKSLVSLMGGDICYAPRAGGGSEFSFMVELPDASEALQSADALDLPPSARSLNILLAEDLPVNQELARAILELAGHRVTTVGDGRAALAAVERDRFDAVLMDVQMPKMDGISATRAIRSLGTPAADVPIIAMTANVLPEQVRAFVEAGMDDHVGKPIDRGELFRALERSIGGKRRSTHHDIGEPAIVNEGTLASVAALISNDRLHAHLQSLRDQLDPATARSLARRKRAAVAHKLISHAGMLGFEDLSESCKALERACLGDGPITEPLKAVREAVERARPRIEAILVRAAA